MAVKAVVFDVGETLVDETRQWSLIAAPPATTPLRRRQGPSPATGMVAVFVVRGPWGWSHWTGERRAEAERAHLMVSWFAGLAGKLAGLQA